MKHIKGKTYDLSQTTMNRLIEELEAAQGENARLREMIKSHQDAIVRLLEKINNISKEGAALVRLNRAGHIVAKDKTKVYLFEPFLKLFNLYKLHTRHHEQDTVRRL